VSGKLGGQELKSNVENTPGTNDQAISAIKTLVERYQKVLSDGKKTEYNETDVSSKFILPLLDALGWNTSEIDEVKEQKRTLTGPVDFSLNINKKPRLLLELKRFSEPLDGKRKVHGRDQTFEEQAVSYAWQLRVDWVVLTNFEELRLYYSRVQKPSEGLVFRLRFFDYIERLDRLWTVSKESVVSKVLERIEVRRTRKDLNVEVLEDLFQCRNLLTQDLRSMGLSSEEIKEYAQRILDRLLTIRVAEDRNIIGADSLWSEVEAWRSLGLPTPLMRRLRSIFHDIYDQYDSKLFAEHPCEKANITNSTIETVLQLLYKYNFDLISADVLGAIYEDYIGHILKAEKDKIDLIANHDVRQSAGIYYTPIPIVDYIVRSTVGRVIQGKSLEEISKLKILDPACGSGSFLIKAFDALKQQYDEYNETIMKKAKAADDLKHYGSLIEDIEKKIVYENTFGVDLDPQATEIAAVNLMLKALRKGERLSLILDENIKCGNSLVEKSKDKLLRPFDWREQFKQVFAEDGFNVVIGNPPWGADLSHIREIVESNFELAKGQYDSYELFLELSKKLLAPSGYWGFVIPDSIFLPEHENLRRFLCTRHTIERIIKLGEGFFEDVFRASVILIFKREPPPPNHKIRVFILLKQDRDKILESEPDIDLFKLEKEKAYEISQSRFIDDPHCTFDIFASDEDEEITKSMEKDTLHWDDLLDTARGVELSKNGIVEQCPNCFKWNSPPRKKKSGEYAQKTCPHCGHKYSFETALKKETIIREKREKKGDKPLLIGEAVNRYYVGPIKYIDTTKDGIDFKEPELYKGPKIVVRKTGVGIYASIDYNDNYTMQVVFLFKPKAEPKSREKLEYILGVLNSRLMLYYYFKKFGDIEWKSFPYMTQKTLQQLPIRKIDFSDAEQKAIHEKIVGLVQTALRRNQPIDEKADFEIEDLVMRLYGISASMKTRIWQELNKVQRLRIIRETLGNDQDEDS